MPVTRVGRYCVRDGCSRPAQERSDLCAKCAHLARAFSSLRDEIPVVLTRERFHHEAWAMIEHILGRDAA